MSSDKIKISVIVPPVVVHNLDPHTGIPFLPHMAKHHHQLKSVVMIRSY